jgi:hypothetical protein
MKRIIAGIAVLAAIVLSASLAQSGTAEAASSPSSAPHVVVIPMHIIGFNPAVAKAHGYVIRTDSQGRQYSVKAGAPAGVRPDDNPVIDGNCGYSFLWYSARGNHTVFVSTGFGLNQIAVSYWWKYFMRDPGGTSSHIHAGALEYLSSWSTGDTWGGMTPGPSEAWVDTGSDALLVSGGVCSSGGPSDSVYIT